MSNPIKNLLAASLVLAAAAASAAGPRLFMAGDSIMAEYRPDEWPQYGWGQALRAFMKDPAALHNCARSGWSARRFRESGRWEKCIASMLKPGDWAIVSFGHNDMNRRRNKPPKNDYSTVDEYKAFLRGFAADAKAKGANIAFATSIVHSSGFGAKGAAMTVDGGAAGLGPYVAAMREVAAETGAPLLDLNRYAVEHLPEMGPGKAKSLYMSVEPGEYANYPKGKHDAAHVRDSGAFFYARAAVEMARAQKLPLAGLFKDPATVDESQLKGGSFEAAVWRGETAYVEIPEALRDSAASLYGRKAGGGVSLTLLRFDEVEYDLSEPAKNEKGKAIRRITGKGRSPDVCREWRPGDKAKPAMLKIAAGRDAKPGKTLLPIGRPQGPQDAFSLTVVDRVLPPAKEWRYFLDLWQHPWAVARFHGVEPFSEEHYAKMEPVWRALADCGCKALTVTLLDLPWNHQCYDGYYSMIGRVRKADGSWAFDYTLFDEYVAFGRKCGLGPDIACYSMCPWRYMMTWKEEDGTSRRERMRPGTPEFDGYWGPFLVDFAAHLKAKGWFDDVYIAMDERSPEDVRKISELIQAKAPGMKIAICGKTKPSAFKGIKIENFCQGLIHLRKDFLPELEPRRKKGCKTTFYVCFSAAHPNTFMHSPSAEGFWLGAYPVMAGFDGFLRWAANSWPANPYKDASYKTESQLVPGDTFLIYPGGELSARLIALRSGVVAAEKMLILRDSGAAGEKDIRRIAAPYGFRGAVNNAFDFSAFRRAVEEFVNAVPSPARP